MASRGLRTEHVRLSDLPIRNRNTGYSLRNSLADYRIDARDLAHFQKLLGFTAHESLIAATYGVAKLFMRSHEMGQIKPGNYADCVLVDGNPLEDIEVLQTQSRLSIIIINGRVHKAGRKEYIGPREQWLQHPVIEDAEFPEVKRHMQKNI